MPRLVRISAGILIAAAPAFLASAQTFTSVATFTGTNGGSPLNAKGTSIVQASDRN